MHKSTQGIIPKHFYMYVTRTMFVLPITMATDFHLLSEFEENHKAGINTVIAEPFHQKWYYQDVI